MLDQFIGGGTTAIECLLLNRRIIGIDINDKAVNITKNRIGKINGKYSIKLGDATHLNIVDKSIDFICTHPPYLNIIKYSKDIAGDISLLSDLKYYEAMINVADECYRILKNNHYCCILIGDIRRNGFIKPLGFQVMNIFLNSGFMLKEIIIKVQHNCSSTEKWSSIAQKRNFLLIKHEYIFVFYKGCSNNNISCKIN